MNNQHIFRTELSFDMSDRIERLKKEFEQAAKDTAERICRAHFSDGRYGAPKGPGYIELEGYLDKMFGTEAMKAKMNKIFEEKFESILTESMTKAIQHRANRQVFAQVDEQAPRISSSTKQNFPNS